MRFPLFPGNALGRSPLAGYAGAVLTGFLLTACQAPLDLSWLAWGALIPLLAVLRGCSFRRGFLLGLLAGLAHTLTLLYWVTLVLRHYGGLSLLETLGPFLLLCAYLALYPALFAACVPFLRRGSLDTFWVACLWTALEYLKAHLLTGFPWCLLGYSQHPHLHLIQITALFGVYGLSFLLLLVNGALERLLAGERPLGGRSLLATLLIPACLVASSLGYGASILAREPGGAGTASLRVAMIQGNIDQAVKWEPAFQETTIHTYRDLSRSTYGFSPDLIVWPETAVPFFFPVPAALSLEILAVTRESGADVLFGAPAFTEAAGQRHFHNRAYLLSRGGEVLQAYDKVHLVPFGEFIPLKGLFSFLHKLLHAVGDFAPGPGLEPLETRDTRIGVLICFESIFPELAREYAGKGARLLVNLTNDAWFGITSAPYQHLVMARFRAVETRTPMIRVANTGFSAVIAADGGVRIIGGLFTREALTAVVPLSRGEVTFYARYGDLLPLLLLIVLSLRLLSGIRRGRSRVPSKFIRQADEGRRSGGNEGRPREGGPAPARGT